MAWRELVCRVFGHRWIAGPLRRSPYTVYTHWHTERCSRCGDEGRYIHHFDARVPSEWPMDDTHETATRLGEYHV